MSKSDYREYHHQNSSLNALLEKYAYHSDYKGIDYNNPVEMPERQFTNSLIIKNLNVQSRQPYNQSSIMSINFGKYKSQSLDEISTADPKYIIYLLTTQYLKKDQRAHIIEKIIDNVKIGFGKYAEQTYNEVLNSNPNYLKWLSENTKHTWIADYLKKYDLK